jgi:hypothetical protein
MWSHSDTLSGFQATNIGDVYEPLSGQTKDYKNSICCFSANHAALRRKSKKPTRQKNGLIARSIKNFLKVCHFLKPLKFLLSLMPVSSSLLN